MNTQEIEQLVKEYKESPNQTTITKIIKLLTPLIKRKSKYVFYHQLNKVSNRYVNLYKNKLCEFADVEQELFLDVLRLIQTYDTTKPFKAYFNAVLRDWTPSFMKSKDFVTRINSSSECDLASDENEAPLDDLAVIYQPEVYNDQTDLSEEESRVLNALIEDSSLNQHQLADKFNCSLYRISKVIKSLREKIHEI